MNRKFLLIPIVVLIMIIFVNFQPKEIDEKNGVIFHATLADPNQYKKGIFSDTFEIKEGSYSFRFVPNGDSPQILSIELQGDNFRFSEDFKLNGTLHKTEISEYYTWDYVGEKIINISSSQEIFIQINPNGNVLGSVSVDIIEN